MNHRRTKTLGLMALAFMALMGPGFAHATGSAPASGTIYADAGSKDGILPNIVPGNNKGGASPDVLGDILRNSKANKAKEKAKSQAPVPDPVPDSGYPENEQDANGQGAEGAVVGSKPNPPKARLAGESGSLDDIINNSKAGQANRGAASSDGVLPAIGAGKTTVSNLSSSKGGCQSSTLTSEGFRTVPPRGRALCDEVGMISPGVAELVAEKLERYRKETTNSIAILIVKDTGIEDIFSYALKVAESWKLGKEKLDNGLLVVVDATKRKINVQTGYGLEGVITDADALKIAEDTLVKGLKAGDADKGVSDLADALIARISQDPELGAIKAGEGKAATSSGNGRIASITLLIVILIVVALRFGLNFAMKKTNPERLPKPLYVGEGVTLAIALVAGLVLAALMPMIFVYAMGTLFDFALRRSKKGGGDAPQDGDDGVMDETDWDDDSSDDDSSDDDSSDDDDDDDDEEGGGFGGGGATTGW